MKLRFAAALALFLAVLAAAGCQKAEPTLAGYRIASPFHEGKAAVFDGAWHYIDRQFRITASFADAEELLPLAAEGAPFRQDGKFGLLGGDLEVLSPPQWEYATPFSSGFSRVTYRHAYAGGFNFLDTAGRELLPSRLEGGRLLYTVYTEAGSTELALAEAKDFGDGLAPIKGPDGKWGYLDTEGKLALNFAYADAQPFSEGLAAVSSLEGWQYVDKRGTVVFAANAKEVFPFRGGYARVKREDGWAVLDKQGKTLLSGLKDCRDFSGGYALMEDGEGWAVLDGEMTIALRLPDGLAPVGNVSEGILAVSGKAGGNYLNLQGELLLDEWAEEVQPFSEGLGLVKKQRLWNFIELD